MTTLAGRSVLLVISGGIAAYKSLELIRLLKKSGAEVRCILTKGGAEFVTALSVAALAEHPVYTDLFSLKDETEMGHIRLSREADLIVVAPASASLISRLANGIADDLASTTLLAANKPILVAPAMNPEMWAKASTQRNIDMLKQDGIDVIGPASGDMACGETGLGRMVEAESIFGAIVAKLGQVNDSSKPVSVVTHPSEKDTPSLPLLGMRAVVTSGPTYEPIDPVRFIGNRSSGKQGHAIATALNRAGAHVTLVTGPVAIPDPMGVKTIHIETAQEMMDVCESLLPCDIAVCAAAVADWRPANPIDHKMKKRVDRAAPSIELVENPDILATIAAHQDRPQLVVGFAAETDEHVQRGRDKLHRKKCDWIVANQVGKSDFPVFGAGENRVTLLTSTTQDDWPSLTKDEVARRLVEKIVDYMEEKNEQHPELKESNAS